METTIYNCITGETTTVYISEEEYNAMRAEAAAREALLRYSPLNDSEVFRLFAKENINTLEVDDNTALRMIAYYPEWAADTSYAIGCKVQRSGKLYRAIQAHTSLAGWEPESAASLWERINEAHSGSMDDPIPYEGNMTLENGKYYI